MCYIYSIQLSGNSWHVLINSIISVFGVQFLSLQCNLSGSVSFSLHTPVISMFLICFFSCFYLKILSHILLADVLNLHMSDLLNRLSCSNMSNNSVHHSQSYLDFHMFCIYIFQTKTLTRSALLLHQTTCGGTCVPWCCQDAETTPGDWWQDRGSWWWRPAPT